MSYTGPYTNFHEINLNLFIRALKKLKGGIGGESLVKKSNVEYDYEWKTLTAQDVGALPDSYTAPVDSVNGKTGAVVLDAQDVGALPDSYTAPVDSVNGKTGAVVLDAQDVGALPDSLFSAIKAAFAYTSLSGQSVFINDQAPAQINPISNITVDLPIIQSGTGTPSPTNIRPITNYTGSDIYHSGPDLTDYVKIDLDFPESTPTVYVASFTQNFNGTWTLTITHMGVNLGDLAWSNYQPENFRYGARLTDYPMGINNLGATGYCSYYNPTGTGPSNIGNNLITLYNSGSYSYLYFRDNNITTLSDVAPTLQDQICVYKLITPLVYTITADNITEFLNGENNFWSSSGVVQITYQKLP